MENINPFQSQEAIKAEARAWVLKFNADTLPTKADIEALQKWAARSPVHRRELERAQSFWIDADRLTELAVPLSRVKRKKRSGFGSFFSSLLLFKWTGAVATVLVLGVAVMFSFSINPWNNKVGNGIYQTVIGEQQTLILADESQIQLDTDSRVRVAYTEGRRQIYLLAGKAYFDVAKNPDRPFEVYAAGGMVRAVGTAFSVYLTPDDVKVTVDEGRVNLYRVEPTPAPNVEHESVSNNANHAINRSAVQNPVKSRVKSHVKRPAIKAVVPEPENVNLTKVLLSVDKGMSASFKEETSRQLAQGELSRELAWRRGLLIFTNDPLSKVIAEVSRYTQTEIEIVDPPLKDFNVGGRFRVGELDALFDVLQAGFGIQITYVDKNHVQLRVPAS